MLMRFKVRRHLAVTHAVLAALASLPFLPNSPAFATTYAWTDAAGSGLWTNALNWSPNGLPAAGDTVHILGGPSFPVGAGWAVDFSNATPLSLAALTVSHSNNLISHTSNALTLSNSTSNLAVSNEFIGDSSAGGTRGFGILNLNAGLHSVQNLTLGHDFTDAGTCDLSAGGTLTVANMTVGASGFGTVNDAGYLYLATGNSNATARLSLGDAAGSSGTFNLQNQTLYLENGTEIIGNSGNGTFTQNGGQNKPFNLTQLSSILLANNAGSTGTYNLTDGELVATYLTLGAGNATFNHSGGTVTLNSYLDGNFDQSPVLVVGEKGTGRYTLGSNASLVVVGGIEVIGANPGGDGTFVQNGGSNILTGGGVLALSDNFTGGGVGTYILNDGLLSAVDGFETIGESQAGTFTQNGGTNRTSQLLVGGYPLANAGTGNYTLSAGDLFASTLILGDQGGTGTFTHGGGNVTLDSANAVPVLQINANGSSNSSYSLSGNARLTVNNNGQEIIGDSTGTALFTQSGGTNTLNASNTGMAQLILAKTAGGTGTYSLSAGNLTVNGTESIGYAGSGTFTQSGGNNTLLAGYLILGNTTNSTGNYTLSAGNLSAPNIGVALPGASANFTQTGGNVTVGSLGIANNAANATGAYSLSNGSITLVGYPSAAYVYVAGSGNGSFTQSGGSIAPAANIDATLYVGFSATAVGSFSLSNGSISIPQGREYIGCYGNGTFTQSGGQNTLAGTAFLSIAAFPGSTGSYLLSGGELSVNNNIYVGGSDSGPGGTGNLTISNSAVLTSAGTLTAFNTANTTISLTGGSLTAAAFVDNAAYSQSGGAASLGPISGNGSISISNGLATAASLHLNFLFLANTGFLQIAPAPANATASTLNTLVFAGSPGHWSGTLDLANNKLILQPSSATKSTALATLQNQVATHAITSSTLPTNFALALLDNALTGFTTFAGQPVDQNSLLLAPELLGDANIDGKVDLTDLSTVLNHFGTAAPNWTDGNFDNAATIDLTDLSDVLNNFGTTNPYPFGAAGPTFNAPAVAVTPEPAPLALFALALLPLSHRRIRKRVSPSHR
ncbi:MAG: beta strand repeat-containing protein [Phycisphaerae bacterium]